MGDKHRLPLDAQCARRSVQTTVRDRWRIPRCSRRVEKEPVTPLFDKSSNHAAWMSNDGRNLFDTRMNWIAYISGGHAWSASSGNWMGSVSGFNCRDRSGRPVLGIPKIPCAGRLAPQDRLAPPGEHVLPDRLALRRRHVRRDPGLRQGDGQASTQMRGTRSSWETSISVGLAGETVSPAPDATPTDSAHNLSQPTEQRVMRLHGTHGRQTAPLR